MPVRIIVPIGINDFAIFIVLLGSPIAVVCALTTHRLFAALVSHLVVLARVGLYDRWRVRAWPVHPRAGARRSCRRLS